MAEWEREEISSRIAASIPIRAKLGKPLGGAAAFGYSWEHKRFVINETEAPIRKLIYEIFLTTHRKKTTADELNRLGHRTRKGALFSGTTVARLLKDTTAKGERIANYTKTSADGKRTVLKPKSDWTITKCPAIVSEKTWNQANHILAEQERKNMRTGRRPEFLLSGLVKCSCSKKMYIKTSLRAYQCRECMVKIGVKVLEGIFWNYLSECLDNLDLEKYTENTNTILQKKKTLIGEAIAEKGVLERTIDKYVSMRMEGQISREDFIEKLHQLNLQIAHMEEFLQRLQSDTDSEVRRANYLEDFIADARFLVKEWPSMEFERKRTLVETVTKDLLITRTEIQIEFSIDLQNVLSGKKILCSDLSEMSCYHFNRRFLKPNSKNYPQNPVTIGDNIRKKRIDDGLSQEKLAKIIGVSAECVAYWENNRSRPNISYYPKIHQFLGFPTRAYDETTLSGRLQSYRFRNGISCKNMAELLKVDASTIRAWEKENNRPSKKILKKLNELFRQNDMGRP